MANCTKSPPLSVTVTTTATQLLAANTGRRSANLAQASGSQVFLGGTAAVTVANGYPMAPNGTLEDKESSDAWWGIVASGTADVRVLEVA